jgi:hypothetical protein
MAENKNKIKTILKEDIFIDSEYEEDENYTNNIDFERKEQEYYNDTLNIIQKNILQYVEEKNLPICEYLSIQNIDIFLNKIIF